MVFTEKLKLARHIMSALFLVIVILFCMTGCSSSNIVTGTYRYKGYPRMDITLRYNFTYTLFNDGVSGDGKYTYHGDKREGVVALFTEDGEVGMALLYKKPLIGRRRLEIPLPFSSNAVFTRRDPLAAFVTNLWRKIIFQFGTEAQQKSMQQTTQSVARASFIGPVKPESDFRGTNLDPGCLPITLRSRSV